MGLKNKKRMRKHVEFYTRTFDFREPFKVRSVWFAGFWWLGLGFLMGEEDYWWGHEVCWLMECCCVVCRCWLMETFFIF